MRSKLPFWIAVAVCVAALGASAILLVDYVRPAPVFCGADGGCGAVKRSALAYPLHIPMPVWGISGLLAVGLFALVPGRRARIAQAVLATFGGIVAAGLLAVQAMSGTFCPYCVVVDSSAVLLLGLSVARAVKGWDPPEGKLHVGGAVAAIVAAVAVPSLVGFTRRPLPSDVPAPIAEEIGKTGSGKVTLVDFVDFECPFCRMTHAELAPVLEKHAGKVRVARKHVPLRMHPHAMDAARGAVCAEKLGKGDAVADALFSARTDDLTPDGIEKIATGLGLDGEAFRACVRDASTDARIKQDSEAFRASGGQGLPTLWFDATKLEGAQDREALEQVLDGAVRAL